MAAGLSSRHARLAPPEADPAENFQRAAEALLGRLAGPADRELAEGDGLLELDQPLLVQLEDGEELDDHVDPLEGFQPYQGRRLIYSSGIGDPSEQKQVLDIVGKLYACFVACDALLCEINPLIVTPAGEVRALDSKFTVDDNALFRHPDIAEMRDLSAYPPEERKAREKGVTYVKLDGEVGVLGNGAGLTMATVDVVTFVGGRPANFCDLGGGQVGATAIAELILSPVALVLPASLTLEPATDTNEVGEPHTVTATATSASGGPVAGATVTFEVVSGPNAGLTGTGVTDAATLQLAIDAANRLTHEIKRIVTRSPLFARSIGDDSSIPFRPSSSPGTSTSRSCD